MKSKKNKNATRALTSNYNSNFANPKKNPHKPQSESFGFFWESKNHKPQGFLMSKRAQEEMVGFVLIVVIVVIIAVIFLGISLRKPGTTASQKSEEVNSFLSSISYYTTDCEIDVSYPRTIGDLVRDCKDNKQCVDNRLACEALEFTLKAIISNSTYVVSDDSSTIYYKLSVYYGLNEESGKLINTISKTSRNAQIGECSGAKVYNIKSFGEETEENNIHMKFEVCYVRG